MVPERATADRRLHSLEERARFLRSELERVAQAEACERAAVLELIERFNSRAQCLGRQDLVITTERRRLRPGPLNTEDVP
jgi:hypothetical protein